MAVIDPNIYQGNYYPAYVRTGFVPPFLLRVEETDDVYISLQNSSAIAGVMQSLFTARAMRDGILSRVDIWIGSPVTNGTARFDVNKNGVSIFSNPNDRPAITSGVFVFTTGLSIPVSLGDKITVDIDQTPTGSLAGPFDCRLIISPDE